MDYKCSDNGQNHNAFVLHVFLVNDLISYYIFELEQRDGVSNSLHSKSDLSHSRVSGSPLSQSSESDFSHVSRSTLWQSGNGSPLPQTGTRKKPLPASAHHRSAKKPPASPASTDRPSAKIQPASPDSAHCFSTSAAALVVERVACPAAILVG